MRNFNAFGYFCRGGVIVKGVPDIVADDEDIIGIDGGQEEEGESCGGIVWEVGFIFIVNICIWGINNWYGSEEGCYFLLFFVLWTI